MFAHLTRSMDKGNIPLLFNFFNIYSFITAWGKNWNENNKTQEEVIICKETKKKKKQNKVKYKNYSRKNKIPMVSFLSILN
jgi:hypothetical protein